MRSHERWRKVGVCALAIALLAAYAAIFLPYLPNDRGTAGHDYSSVFPSLLTGYYWFLENGLWLIPWFSPALCGGFPFFPDPITGGYYAIPQFLTFIVSPLRAIQTTLLLFAIVGFVGFYVLMRRGFGSSRSAAVLAAGVFMFNGYFAHRILIGHLTFHAFMLLPVFAAALLPAPRMGKVSGRSALMRICVAGLCLCYMVHSGMVHGLPPALLATGVIMVLHALMFGWQWFPWLAYAVTGVLALMLSAGKLVAVLSLLSNFPRDYYPLPGIRGLGIAAWLVFRTLFFDVPEDAPRAIVNSMWRQDRHEWEYGVSPTPLLFMIAAAVAGMVGMLRRQTMPQIGIARVVALTAVVVLLSVPIAINLFIGDWNRFLKSLPFLGSSSNLLRWFSTYIAVVVLLAGLALDRLPLGARVRRFGRPSLAAIGLVIMLVTHARTDRNYYYRQEYDVGPVEAAWANANSTGQVPPIRKVIVRNLPSEGGLNDAMIRGSSQIVCYQPIMGYRLEKFPIAGLRPGPVFPPDGNAINMKNPACYVFPKENDCRPGDHFAPSARVEAEAFARYRPFAFSQPLRQRFATGLSLLSLIGTVGALTLAGIGAFRARRRARSRDGDRSWEP